MEERNDLGKAKGRWRPTARNSYEARKPGVFEITFALGILARCGKVSRRWRDAVDHAHRMFVHLDLSSHDTRVTGGIVRRALELIAGSSLRSVGLVDCRGIGGQEAEAILDLLVATCPKVEKIQLAGCRWSCMNASTRCKRVLVRSFYPASSSFQRS